MRRSTRHVRQLLINKKPTTDIVTLGDSNTEISYFSTIPQSRWASILASNLGKTVVNMGKDGRSTFDFILPDSIDGTNRKQLLINYNALYYIICFGLNDEKYSDVAKFEADTRELISIIQTQTRGMPILMTNVWVDYPTHYDYDRNTEKIEPYDNVKRALATELGLNLIEVYTRFQTEYTENSIWDTRIRTTEIWDDSEDYLHPDDPHWYSNIHYNVLGNSIVADEVTKYFQDHIL